MHIAVKRKGCNYMDNLYWVGIRESEVQYTNFINNSITIFGNNNISMQNKLKKIIDHNNTKNFDLIDNFFNKEAKEIIKKNPKVRFMYYSQINSYDSIKKFDLLDYVICLNNQELVEYLSDKFKLKDYFKEFIPILDYELVKGINCTVEKIQNKFNTNIDEFIIQSATGSGGSGTMVLSNKSENKLEINKEQIYMVTKYCKNNIPINMHVLISDNEIQMLPPSIQIIQVGDNKLLYKGCDYIAYKKEFPHELNEKFKRYCKIVAKKLQDMGYRGVLGIDSIAYEGEIYLMEINTRFQNSSTILNRALLENNLPSIQELHYNCFYNRKISIKDFDVNYSCYIKENGIDNKTIDIKSIDELDKINNNIEKETLCYLCTSVYNNSIYKKVKT